MSSNNNNRTPNSHEHQLGVNRSFKKHIPLPAHQPPLNHDHAISANSTTNFNPDVAAAVCVNWPPLILPPPPAYNRVLCEADPPVLDSKEEYEKMLRELTCLPSNGRRSLMSPTAATQGISQVLAPSDHLYPNQISNVPSPPQFHILSLPSLTPSNCTGQVHSAHHIPAPYSHPSMPPAAATTQRPWVMAPNATPYPHENSYFPSNTPSHLINLLPSLPVRSSYLANWERQYLSADDGRILERTISHNDIAAARNTARVPRLNSSLPAPTMQQQQQFSVRQIGGSPPQGVPMLQSPAGAGQAIQAQTTSFPTVSLLPGVPAAGTTSPLPPPFHSQFVCPGSPTSATKPVSPTSSLESTNVRSPKYDSLQFSPEFECLLFTDPPPALNLPFELLPTDRFGIQGLPDQPAEPCFIVNTDSDAF